MTVRNLLLAEQFRLEKIINEIETRLKVAPPGRIRLSKSHNHIQYYRCTEEKKCGNYIPKENWLLAQQLAQKSYDEKVLQLTGKRLSQIKRIAKDYMDDELEKIYLKEHIERQKLIVPAETTWKQKVNEWLSEEYKGKDFQEGTPVILTEGGE